MGEVWRCGCPETSTGSLQRATASSVPHVLVFPLPLHGHVTPMLHLAEVLSLQGIHVTFLATHHVRDRLGAGVGSRLSRHPRLRLCSISDGLPPDNPRSVGNLGELYISLTTVTRPLFQDLLRSMQAEQERWPPLTCVITDMQMDFAAEVAEELKVPVFIFCTSSPCSFWVSFCIPKLIARGELPFADCDMDKAVQGVPGAESFLRRRDLPSNFRTKGPNNDPVVQHMAMVTHRATRAAGLIFNTMEPLDAHVLAQIRIHCPNTYTVGPLHTLVKTLLYTDDGGGGSVPSPPPSAQKDDTCMTWLDSQPLKSVVYVSFGSMRAVNKEQLLEFWRGLVNSGHRFLFVIRPDLVAEMEATGEIPKDVAEGTKQRAFLVGWAPQLEVLAHPAVGAFLSHSGWNSTLESIVAGVPMICWPFFFDQPVNSRYVSEVWRVGVDMKDTCDRLTVEKMVKEVMEGETAEGMRGATGDMTEMARECTAKGGSSRTSLENLLHKVRSMSIETPGTP